MIQMKAGTFGLPVNGIVKAMTKDSGPFEASKEQEARLVKLGLAVYVDEAPEQGDKMPELPDGVIGIPEYSIENTANELREIGKLCGLTFKAGTTKAEMVEALDAHIAANTVDGVEIPDEDASDEAEATEDDGEGAPTFDASQAVQ